jgi:periplasmic protein TonB
VSRPDAGGPRVAALPPAPEPAVPDLRSALRRGAGGQGEGRGGIEGEPIPLDSPDPKYNDYLEQVRRKIKANWGFPCVPDEGRRRCDYKTTQLVVEFGIAKDGRVPFVVVRNSSGFPIYDDYAVNAIKFSSPFPPVPDSVSRTGFPINATFRYVVESSLTNLLR